MEGMNSPEEHGEKDMEGQGSSDIDEEDVAKAVHVGRNKDDEDLGKSGCFLAVLPSHTGGHLGVKIRILPYSRGVNPINYSSMSSHKRFCTSTSLL